MNVGAWSCARGICLNTVGSEKKEMGATEMSPPNKSKRRSRSRPKLSRVQKQHECSGYVSHISQQPWQHFSRGRSSEATNAENCGSSSYFMLANGAEQFWLNLLTELEKLPWKIQHRVKADKFSHR